MSKEVKDLMMQSMRDRFKDVRDLLVVELTGIGGITDNQMRVDLRKKDIHLMVLKNSLAKRVFKDLKLEVVNQYLEGPRAVAWGGPSVVELAKEITDWRKKVGKLQIRGGTSEGKALGPAEVEALSKLPSREELIGRVAGLAQSPGSRLAGLLAGAGGRLVSQIKSRAEGAEEGEAADATPGGEATSSP